MPSGYFLEALGKFLLHVANAAADGDSNTQIISGGSGGSGDGESRYLGLDPNSDLVVFGTAILTHHNTYLQATSDGLVARDNHRRKENIFRIIHVGKGKVAIKTFANTYLSAEPDGFLATKSKKISNLQTFELIELKAPPMPTPLPIGSLYLGDTESGKVAFKSHHQRYLCVEPNGTVVVNRTKLDIWETFHLVDPFL